MTLKRHNDTSTSSKDIWIRNVRRRIVGGTDDDCITPTTTTTLDNLDNNLLWELLTRVPAKTLAGLKVINTRWYDMISDPFFINKHTTSSLQTTPYDAFDFFTECYTTPGSIIQLSYDRSSPNLLSETIIPIGLPDEFHSAFIEASCDGLLFLSLKTYTSKKYARSSTLCIFNPLTKKRKMIPSPYKRKICRFGLVFGIPTSSLYYYSRYTVVCLVYAKTAFEFKIFVPEKGRWRDCNKSTRISYVNDLKEKCAIGNPVCFRGIIHWLTKNGYIISFNLDKEESRMFPIPACIPQMVVGTGRFWWCCARLGLVQDEISLVVVTPENEIVTWVLYDYVNNKWEIKRKDTLVTERNPDVYIQPMFFNGESFFLNYRSLGLRSNWQEHNVVTGVTRSLCSEGHRHCFPNISTLIEV